LVSQANRNVAAGRLEDARKQLAEARALNSRATGLVSTEASLDRARGQKPAPSPAPKVSSPELTAKTRREVAQLYQRGLSAMRAGKADEAIRYWELVWEKAPDYQNVRQSLKQEYLTRGMEYFAAGNLNDAVQFWERALRLDPNDEKARAYLSRAQEHLMKTREIGSR
jgi:tetratricopeptide (TPR) repeat protein